MSFHVNLGEGRFRYLFFVGGTLTRPGPQGSRAQLPVDQRQEAGGRLLERVPGRHLCGPGAWALVFKGRCLCWCVRVLACVFISVHINE